MALTKCHFKNSEVSEASKASETSEASEKIDTLAYLNFFRA